MLLFVAPPERSIARNVTPSSPAGLIPPKPRKPPMLTEVLWSNLGVWVAICALLERAQMKLLNPSPPTNTLPLVSTSSDPYIGELGMLTGDCQVTPPLRERWNCTPPPLQLMPSSAWYWNPCPGPLVLSIVSHCLSPPPAPRSPESSVQDWPPLSERHRSSQKKDWFTSDWRLR